MIDASGNDVKAGSSLVGETGEALQKIVGEVTAINENVVAISRSANEQSAGLQDINESVVVIDQGTQQNAAVAQQTFAASQSLAGEVAEIDRMLGEFKTEDLEPETGLEMAS